MAETKTATAVELELTPPDPVPVVSAAKASGLVPVSEDKKSKLEEKADAFVADLVAQDANSPEFGQKVAAETVEPIPEGDTTDTTDSRICSPQAGQTMSKTELQTTPGLRWRGKVAPPRETYPDLSGPCSPQMRA